MEDQKLENLLNLALGATEEEREKSLNFSIWLDSMKNMLTVFRMNFQGDRGRESESQER